MRDITGQTDTDMQEINHLWFIIILNYDWMLKSANQKHLKVLCFI